MPKSDFAMLAAQGQHDFNRRRRRLRRSIRGFFGGIAIIFFLLYVWQARTEIERQQENFFHLKAHQLNTMVQQIRRRLDGHFHDLLFLRETLHFDAGQSPYPDLESRKALESYQKNHRNSLAINIQDGSGNTIVWSTNRAQSPHAMVPESAFFTASDEPDWLVAEPLYAPRYGLWIVPTRIPLYDARGKPAGFLGQPIAMRDLLSEVPQPGVVVLVEHFGQPIAELDADGHWGPPDRQNISDLQRVRAPILDLPWDLEMRWRGSGWLDTLSFAQWLQLSLPFVALMILLWIFYRTAIKNADSLLGLRQFQSAALVIHHRLLRVKNLLDLYPAICDAVVQETSIHSCFLLQADSKESIVNLLAMASTDRQFVALKDLSLPVGTAGEVPQTLVGRALHRGNVQRIDRIQDCVLLASLKESLAREDLCCAIAQPIFLEGRSQAWGVLLCLLREQNQTTNAVEPFLQQVAESFGLILSLWQRRDALEQAQGMLDLLADFDPLTGAANRSRLEQAYTRFHFQVVESGEGAALAVLDIDDFHQINERFQRQTGDQILALVRERLESVLGLGDLVARLGGDEFILLFSVVGGVRGLRQKLDDVEAALGIDFALPDGKLQLAASIGVAMLAGDEEHYLDSLLRQARQALSLAKAHKADRLHSWAIAGQELETKARTLAQRLLAENALEVWYQPIIDGFDGGVRGVEALARLRDVDGRVLTPAEFLPHLKLEEIQNLSWQLLTAALQDISALEKEGWLLGLSFNIPAQSFTRYCLPCLRGVLAASPVSPERITMEILEGGDFLDQPVAAEVMAEIRGMGIHLALDDVGTAYASLQRLRDLPIDKIKVDQHFVRALPDHPEDLHFIRVLQDLAEEIGVELVVEGVETAEILDVLLTLGVAKLQGYGISRPLPFKDLRRFLEAPLRLDGVRPATLFGLFAGILSIHAVIKKTLQPLGRQLFVLESALRRDGPYDAALSRLGYTPGEPLHIAYRRYQSMLSRALAGGADSPHNRYWQDVEEALRDLQSQILAERQREIPGNGDEPAP
ncbi:EAL domain-containing protein [Acidithiobacillus sp. YTS05]|uniref:EAL domain-containing protein n=1 Tax=Igneacidithiobacillus copahuensis TaxID=2724909 RepID=A0AAE2YP26_9PROT|nr:EAL domain-containing protein [Igneacidithiobacillus copahuensis]MBU2787554.1 EAL domain-containing protein [Igneacidithiobacillus copahuensis]MBU2797569.1 EAL domain-containing protein [Acidithiobacillus sp. VAN18-2]UTV80752.1 EAL domain-containing protein [Acidithiobacillus sp. YTS05]